MSETPETNRAIKPGRGNPVTRLLGSLVFALTVVLLLALACIAGTLVPQGTQVESYLAQPGGHPVLGVLSALGLTRMFYSWWFIGLLFALAASLMVCTGRRYRAISRVTGAARLRVVGSFITHVSLLLVLAGGMVRVIWGQKGVIQFHEGQAVNSVESNEGAMPLSFSIRLVKFELEFHEKPETSAAPMEKLMVEWAEKNLLVQFPVDLNVEHSVAAADSGASSAFKVTVLRHLADFSVDSETGEVRARSEAPHNPALQIRIVGSGVTNTQWVFARFPDFGGEPGSGAAMPLRFRYYSAPAEESGNRGTIKSFKSMIEVIENGSVAATRTIEVNASFSWRGYTFYQTSYNPDDLTWSALQVVRDPGVPIVYAGFVLMMAGLTMVFCVGPWLAGQGRTAGEVP